MKVVIDIPSQTWALVREGQIPVRAYECIVKGTPLLESEDCISRQAVLKTISELNAISFYEAQEDSKECYYEIRQAIENEPPVTPLLEPYKMQCKDKINSIYGIFAQNLVKEGKTDGTL